VVQIQKAVTIKPNQALRLRAIKDTVDVEGKARKTGEEWLVRTPGAYLPQVEEEIVQTLDAFVLTDKKAIHLRATRTFEDTFKTARKAGEGRSVCVCVCGGGAPEKQYDFLFSPLSRSQKEWLVTVDMAETHIPDVYEQVVGEVKLTSLNSRQYCVVVDPWKNGKQVIGQKELRRGEASFFLKPGESLEKGIQNVYVLQEDEALLLKAVESYKDVELKEVNAERKRDMSLISLVSQIQNRLIKLEIDGC
jgi:major vault protein